ncbi:transglutaminase-like superfamily protein [Methanobrevibacter cuticularis]|uniref:Transglutaminase-like superfamily protein n=1 Tax=Methanobrevibacter cuticularis TaxID=47311 RepID=A0A166FM38_9EURY|nr:transglutaminase-like superfamily protein [Methanobrevibacter cuticularis]
MSKVNFVNNKAKIFSLGVKAPKYVIKGDKVVVESYLTCGDNLLNAIYTTTNNVVKDGLSINKSNKASGVTMIIEANNKKYTSKSSSAGVAEIKIPTLSSAVSSSLKITVLYDKKGEPKKKATVKVSYKSLKKSYLTNIKSSLKKLKVSDYKGYSKVLNYEKQIKQYLKDVKKSKLSKTNKNDFNKLANKVLSSINTKKTKSLSALNKTINSKRTFASSSEKKSYSSQLKDLKKTIYNSKDLTKKSKKNKITEVNKLINKVNKLQIQSRTPFSTTTYEGSTKVVTKWSDLIKAKNDHTEITAKVVTNKNITVDYKINYHGIVGNEVFNLSTYTYYIYPNFTEVGQKTISVDDQVQWILLSNNNLKEKYRWNYQNSTTYKFYKGTKEVFKYDKNGKLISSVKYYNQPVTETLHKVVQEDFSKYVLPSEFSESNNPEIIELANRIKANCSDKSDFAVANAILKWVQYSIKYEEYGNTMQGALETLHSKFGNCADQAHLTVALLRAVNIPAKYTSKIANISGSIKGHAWSNTLLTSFSIEYGIPFHFDDNWICAQPTADPTDPKNPALVILHDNKGKIIYQGNIKLGWHLSDPEWCTIEAIEYYTSYILDTFKLVNISGTWYIAFQNITVDGIEKVYWGNV